MKKKIWILGLGLVMMLVMSVSAVALAKGEGTPSGGDFGGSKNCIGWCLSRYDFDAGSVDEFAKTHTEMHGTDLSICPMMLTGDGTIPDAPTPTP